MWRNLCTRFFIGKRGWRRDAFGGDDHSPSQDFFAPREYQGLAGGDLLEAARCAGYAVAPVATPRGVVGVLYGDAGPDGLDIVAEQAAELAGLATQAGLVTGAAQAQPTG